ncbi:cadherin-24 [Lepisosteus oculatus]|uniref:cadherin-24 n=1 Tax=Lepisosteus oculatus TaxID=7918 RepID=UPI00371CB172
MTGHAAMIRSSVLCWLGLLLAGGVGGASLPAGVPRRRGLGTGSPIARGPAELTVRTPPPPEGGPGPDESGTPEPDAPLGMGAARDPERGPHGAAPPQRSRAAPGSGGSGTRGPGRIAAEAPMNPDSRDGEALRSDSRTGSAPSSVGQPDPAARAEPGAAERGVAPDSGGAREGGRVSDPRAAPGVAGEGPAGARDPERGAHTSDGATPEGESGRGASSALPPSRGSAPDPGGQGARPAGGEQPRPPPPHPPPPPRHPRQRGAGSAPSPAGQTPPPGSGLAMQLSPEPGPDQGVNTEGTGTGSAPNPADLTLPPGCSHTMQLSPEPGPDQGVNTEGTGTGSAPNPAGQTLLLGFGHTMQLNPEPGPDRSVHTEGTGSGVALDPRRRGGRGLVFQQAGVPAVSAELGGGPGRAGEETRPRSRRSWIWNQFFVIEEYSGPEPVLIGRLHTDMDRGDGRTRYVLRGEGAGSVFVIDERSGNIHVTKPLDREEKDEYRLVATAMDRLTERPLEPSSQFVIRVQDINDNPPVFQDGPYSATVPEMANIGTSIIQVTATDADDPTYGNSARLVYTLLQGQPYFSVDPQTGVLRTAIPNMDRETQDQYLVVLQAKDMGGHLGGLSGTTTVTVSLSDVNDNPPRFTQSMWSFSVSELAQPGAEVGRLSAMDADVGENAELEFSVLEGEGSDIFNISGRELEAVITLNKAVDYEARSSYSFSVEVVNSRVDPLYLRRGPFKDRASVRVAVLDADEPPRFSRAQYHLGVIENAPPQSTVGRLSATDPDTSSSSRIRYSIEPHSDPEALFRIDPDSGLITTATELDRESDQWHNITVIATERDSPSQWSRVLVAIETLDLNDNAPELEREYNTALCDSAQPGEVVQVLRAIDRDSGGNETQVHFSIAPEASTALNFTVKDIRGSTASLVLHSSLPRAAPARLSLRVPVVLRDGLYPGLSSTGTVTVSVCPCLRALQPGGHRACLPLPSSAPATGLSTTALLAILACIATLLAVSALSVSLRRQKRDSLSPLDEEDVRENIITYDDEGGGEEDTSAFDISALQHAPAPAPGWFRTLDSRYLAGRPWSRSGEAQNPEPGHLPYSSHTLPAARPARPARQARGPFQLGPGCAELAHGARTSRDSRVCQPGQNQDWPRAHSGPSPRRPELGGAPRWAALAGTPGLSLRVGEFLRLRLDQLSHDPSLPPYDSVQIYGFEGRGSRAGSLSSLGSEAEREGGQLPGLSELLLAGQGARREEERERRHRAGEEDRERERGHRSEEEERERSHRAGEGERERRHQSGEEDRERERGHQSGEEDRERERGHQSEEEERERRHRAGEGERERRHKSGEEEEGERRQQGEEERRHQGGEEGEREEEMERRSQEREEERERKHRVEEEEVGRGQRAGEEDGEREKERERRHRGVEEGESEEDRERRHQRGEEEEREREI